MSTLSLSWYIKINLQRTVTTYIGEELVHDDYTWRRIGPEGPSVLGTYLKQHAWKQHKIVLLADPK